MAVRDGLGQSPHGDDAHACRSQPGRGRCQFAGAWDRQSVRGREFGVSHLWIVESNAQSRRADPAAGRSSERVVPMSEGCRSRRSVLLATAGGGVLVAAALGYEAVRLIGRRPPSPYDDLLSLLPDRGAAAQVGLAYLDAAAGAACCWRRPEGACWSPRR